MATLAPEAQPPAEHAMNDEQQALWSQFQAIIAEKLEIAVERVQRDALFVKDLKADSLDMVDLLMELEDRFHIVIAEKEAGTLATAGAFFDYVWTRIKTNAA